MEKGYLRIVYICQMPKQGQLIQRLFVLIVRKRQCAQIFSLWFTFQIYTTISNTDLFVFVVVLVVLPNP